MPPGSGMTRWRPPGSGMTRRREVPKKKTKEEGRGDWERKASLTVSRLLAFLPRLLPPCPRAFSPLLRSRTQPRLPAARGLRARRRNLPLYNLESARRRRRPAPPRISAIFGGQGVWLASEFSDHVTSVDMNEYRFLERWFATP
ncbi:hypothetical protein PVAP13_7NG376921 [Panicum virgatum]|uniref:Uncharacterized protein n=1 Tax=Panicum virgatum TaxID=38727 RepID=A0A8T0Q7B4_PANVG|nr:hypothetical protein PVAP13_7NG376921 [Panicum virgatum]